MDADLCQQGLAAIGNFWLHRERNPGISIQFRYLTTSNVGRERGDDLTLSVPGLAAWEAIRQNPTSQLAEARAIQEFLALRQELPTSMREWLATASTGDFVTRIVMPFQWLTDQPGSDATTRRIEAKLIELGEPRGIGAADAANALGKLHLEAWANATNPDREPLRRGDVLRILEAAGSITMPTSELLALMKKLTDPGSSRALVSPIGLSLAGPPTERSRRLARMPLESAIKDALGQGTVLIHGSTGTGKTDLAAAAVRSFKDVGWLDLRDLGPSAIASRIDAASAAMQGHAPPRILVLDDFESGDDPRVLVPSLSRLAKALQTAKASLMITASQPLPPRFDTVLDFADNQSFLAPHFEPEEIAAYLAKAGCPPEYTDTWSKILHASTGGHPQLVDARLGALLEQDWPSPNLGEWLTPTSELLDVRAEARRMVAKLEPDERELLARASLVLGRVSRRRLIAIAQISPSLLEPGHAIDRLVGPWLEVTDTSDLRISPLLRGLGVDTRGQAWAADMHAGIAWAWVVDGKLAATDVSTLLMHAMVSGRMGPLVHILPSLLDAPAEVWQQIGETSGMFASIGLEAGQMLPWASTIDQGVFRILQLRIAAESEPDQVKAVVSAAFREADASRESDVGNAFFQFMFLWQLVRLKDVKRCVDDAVDLALRFVRVANRVRVTLATYGEEGREISDAWIDLSPVVSMTVLSAISDRATFDQFVERAKSLPADIALPIFPGQGHGIDMAGHALDRLWLSESRSEHPEWAAFVASLERAIIAALDIGAKFFAEAAAALQVRVVDENTGDPETAIAVADRLMGMLDASPGVEAAKAKVLWRSGDLSDALEIYGRILPDLRVPQPYLTEIWREAAIASARAGDWKSSASRFAGAVSDHDYEEIIERKVGLSFDRGLALHQAGETRAATAAFAEAVDALIEDGRETPPEPLLSVRQYGSQIIKDVLVDVAGRPKDERVDAVKLIGAASSLDTLNWGDQRPCTTAMVVSALMELELTLPTPPVHAAKLATWLRGAGDSLTLATTWATFNRLAVSTFQVSELISDTIRELSYLAHVAEQRVRGGEVYSALASPPPIQPLTASSEVFFVFRILMAMVVLLADGKIDQLPLDQWRNDLPDDPTYDVLRDFLTEVHTTVLGPSDPWPRVTDKHDKWSTQAVISIAALSRDRTPTELIAAQSLSAYYLNQPQLSEFVAEPFSKLVTDAWERLCRVPALLVNPRISVPAIERSIETNRPSWGRTKAVLQAALNAVPRAAAEQVRGWIESLPDA